VCDPIRPIGGDSYARIKVGQQRLGLSLDENDLWIAATAAAGGATRDNDFLRVPALSVLIP
jgi:predicted nucleic acid-binding protein